MLEKKEKKLNFDAHFHYFDCKKLGLINENDKIYGISCAHSVEEWNIQKNAPESVIKSFGIHPLDIEKSENRNFDDDLIFLENLLENKEVSCIGEIGFDYFDLKNNGLLDCEKIKKMQDYYFVAQIEYAIKYNVPVVIHCRKANEKLFEYENKLRLLPEVLFHSFMGSSTEALSLLKKGINGYFSFGKQIFNNNKKVLDCVKNLPEERVLGETDAPFQTLKGEKYTKPSEINKIIEEIKRIKCLSI